MKDAQEALVAEKQKAEEVQKAEEAKKTKYEKLFDLARRIGLDKGTAHDFANANLDTAESELLSALNKTIQQDQAEKQKQGIDKLKGISSDEYQQGKIISEDIYEVTETNNDYVVKKVQRKMLYNQKYSATIADYYVQESYDKETGRLTEFDTLMANIRTQGLKTQVADLPKEGSALMNPLMIFIKIIKLRWIHILSYDQMVSPKINNQTTKCANSIFYTTLFTNSAPNYT